MKLSIIKGKIKNIKEELKKPYAKIAILVFLVSILSFGTGYLIGRDWNPAPIVIEQNNN